MLEFLFRLLNTVGLGVVAFLIVGVVGAGLIKFIGFVYEAETGKSFQQYLDSLKKEDE